jgi:hypothetical protein
MSDNIKLGVDETVIDRALAGTASPEESKQFLIEAGILLEDGTPNPVYYDRS